MSDARPTSSPTSSGADGAPWSAAGGTAQAPSAPLQRVVRLAATLLDVPVALVSLLVDEHQHVRASTGLSNAMRASGEVPLLQSVCRHVVADDRPLLIEDTEASSLAEARRAAAELGLRSYAGVPIRSPQGGVLGTVCVGDERPRAWGEADAAILHELAEVAALELELQQDLRAARKVDALTGLPDGRGCEALVTELELLARSRGSAVAVLVVELDNAELVYDGLGRRTGDHLVIAAARRLEAALTGVGVGRLGGGRFAVVGEAPDDHGALALADRVRAALAAPVEVGDRTVSLASSIGIALSEPGDRGADLLDAARSACREAQDSPNHVESLRGHSLRERAAARLKLDVALRRALGTEEFSVHYQPLYDLRRGTPSGFEALARWTSPELGPVSPGDFVPIAEESGLIATLGRRVLLQACEDAVSWGRLASGYAPGVSVNVSPEQLGPGLPGLVADVLRRTGLAPNRLTLELTETALVGVDSAAADVLAHLGELGVHLALDDFGVGFSSLSQLAALPLTVLKLDRSFVARLGEPRTLTVVAAVVAMGRSLDLSVTAEGIETDAVRERMTELGCTHGQGFGLGRPADVRAARALVAGS